MQCSTNTRTFYCLQSTKIIWRALIQNVNEATFQCINMEEFLPEWQKSQLSHISCFAAVLNSGIILFSWVWVWKDFDVSHLSANNTLKVIQDMKIKNNNDKTIIFHECVEKMWGMSLFSKPFDSFNRVFNISIPQEVFHIVWNNSYSNSRVCN